MMMAARRRFFFRGLSKKWVRREDERGRRGLV
jgi:hypothetical protein